MQRRSHCEPRLLIEKLEGIHNVIVHVHTATTGIVEAAIQAAIGTSITLVLETATQLIYVKVPLGAVVHPTTYSKRKYTDYIQLKIGIELSPTTDDEIERLPSVQELLSLCCRRCSASLIVPRNAQSISLSVHSLPSPYWLELANEWTCGNCCFFTQFPREEIQARPSSFFIGEQYVLVHTSLVISDAWIVDEQNINNTFLPNFQTPEQHGESTHIHLHHTHCHFNKHDENTVSSTQTSLLWIPILCSSCQTPLGVGEIDPSASTSPHDFAEKLKSLVTTNIRLYRHRVSSSYAPIPKLHPLNEPHPLFHEDTLETFCASHILHASQAHTCYRFILCSHKRLRAMLLLTNWQTSMSTDVDIVSDREVAYSEESTEVLTLPPPRRVLKVQYRALDSHSAAEQAKEWTNKHKIETLVLAEEECDELLEVLTQSTRLLPPSLRSMPGSGMCVGFLRRRQRAADRTNT